MPKYEYLVCLIRPIITFFCVALLTGIPIHADESPQLILNDADWPPYFFAGNLDSPKGLGKEIVEACLSKITAQPFKFQFHPINEMWLYLKNGRLDMNVNSHKKSREEIMVFSKEPIFSAGYKPFVSTDSNITIETLDDFNNLNIGHLDGLKYSDWFLEYILNRQTGKLKVPGKIIVSDSSEKLIQMLLQKRIDVFVEAGRSILWRAKVQGISDKIKMLDYEIRTSNYFLTISKKSTKIKDKKAFLSRFDECLRQLKKNGQYDSIMKKYSYQ